MERCAFCGGEIDPATRLCRACGRPHATGPVSTPPVAADGPAPRNCPRCGTPAQVEDRVCRHCALPLQRPCPNCRQEVPVWAAFCPNCAYRLGAQEAEKRDRDILAVPFISTGEAPA